MIASLRGLTQDQMEVSEEPLKSELDPEFLDDEGSFDPDKWRAYIDSRPASFKQAVPKLTPRNRYERDFIRLVYRVIDWCRWVEASESRMWPRNVDGSLPGTPWDQPFWRRRLMDAFWEGQSEMRSERQKKT